MFVLSFRTVLLFESAVIPVYQGIHMIHNYPIHMSISIGNPVKRWVPNNSQFMAKTHINDTSLFFSRRFYHFTSKIQLIRRCSQCQWPEIGGTSPKPISLVIDLSEYPHCIPWYHNYTHTFLTKDGFTDNHQFVDDFTSYLHGHCLYCRWLC